MMGARVGSQDRLFYEFHLDAVVPGDHLVRKIDGVLDGIKVDIDLFFQLSLHHACHATCLTNPATDLIRYLRQALRAQHDEPDKDD